MGFDPDAAAAPGSGVFGLPHVRAEAAVVLIPVPWDATTSYGHGTAKGPEAIRAASTQVDLYDRRFGRVYERGIFMEPVNERIAALSARMRALSGPLIARGGAAAADAPDVERIDAAGDEVNAWVRDGVNRVLHDGRTPGLVGGEHAVSFGAIQACAEHFGPIGVLQVDAHMDLRERFEGFEWSHASIIHNVITRLPRVARIVQVGIRDFGEGEMDRGIEVGDRVVTFYDDQWHDAMDAGTPFADLASRAIAALPERVYVTFDIDGLDPSLCPHTGTPVPGGLSFHQASQLLWTLRESGRRVVGFDLVEVAPGPSAPPEGDEPEWDANVGARVLYKLCALSAPRDVRG